MSSVVPNSFILASSGSLLYRCTNALWPESVQMELLKWEPLFASILRILLNAACKSIFRSLRYDFREYTSNHSNTRPYAPSPFTQIAPKAQISAPYSLFFILVLDYSQTIMSEDSELNLEQATLAFLCLSSAIRSAGSHRLSLSGRSVWKVLARTKKMKRCSSRKMTSSPSEDRSTGLSASTLQKKGICKPAPKTFISPSGYSRVLEKPNEPEIGLLRHPFHSEHPRSRKDL